MDIQSLIKKYYPNLIIFAQHIGIVAWLSASQNNIPKSYLIALHSVLAGINGLYAVYNRSVKNPQELVFLQDAMKKVYKGKNGEITVLTGIVFNDKIYPDSAQISTSPVVLDSKTNLYTDISGITYKVIPKLNLPK